MKRFFLFVVTLLSLATLAQANCTGSSPTWTATPDQASVASCASQASPGDTINVTAGSGSVRWTAGIAGTKAISIVGPGPNVLTIYDNIPTTNSPCNMFQFRESVVGSLTRISGFTLQPAPGVKNVCQAIAIQGTCNTSSCPNLRIDNNVFSGWAAVNKFISNGSPAGYGINAIGDMFGVIDHNVINGNLDGTKGPGGYLQFAEISHASFPCPGATCPGGNGDYGDASWALPENYGSANFIYFENNTFNAAACCENEGNTPFFAPPHGRGGTRVVVRFNKFNLDTLNFGLGWHGTESNGRARGGRAFEFYANTITCQGSTINGQLTGCGQGAGARSGTGLVWGNSTSIPAPLQMNSFFTLTTYRVAGNINWGACDGSSTWDANEGTTYYSGTVGSVSGTANYTITVGGTSPGWSTNYWTVGNGPSPLPGGAYSVHDVTQNTGAEIVSSGANTLSMIQTGGSVLGHWTPAVNDSIRILRATSCVDQAGGRGAGVYYSGIKGNSPASPLTASGQVSSPTYLWANPFPQRAPSVYINSPVTNRVIANRDWYADNVNQTAQTSASSPFNGTSGTGYGPCGAACGGAGSAFRPTTCTTGVAYWATDVGSWNTINAPIPGITGSTQGKLYICTATNTWTLSYTPGTYPHSLDTTVQPVPPIASPSTGVVPQTVTLSDASPRTIICWNTTGGIGINGAASCPAGSSTYTAPFVVSVATTIYFVAGGPGYIDSLGVAATYIPVTPHVQDCVPVTGSATQDNKIVVTCPNVGAHHKLVFGLYWGTAATIISVASAMGATYTILDSGYNNSSGISTGVVYTPNTVNGGNETFTVKLSTPSGYRYAGGMEINLPPANNLDGSSDNPAQSTGGGTATPTSGTATPSTSKDFVVGFFGSQAGCSWTPGTDGNGNTFYLGNNNVGIALEWFQESSPGPRISASIGCSSSSAWNAHMVMFLPSSLRANSPNSAPTPIAIAGLF